MELESLWSKGFGRVATRSAQTLLIFTLIGTVIFALNQLSLVVVPLILATILASAIYPLVTLMEKLRINRTTGSLITIFAFFTFLGGIGYFIFSSVRTQWESLSNQVRAGFEQIVEWLHSGDLPVPVEQIDGMLGSASSYFKSSSFSHGAIQFSGDLASVLAGFILTILIMFFFLKDGKNIYAFLVSFLSENLKAKAHEAGVGASSILGGYIRGTTMVAAVDVLLIGIGLLIMDVPLIVPLCLLVFIGAYIPYVGATSAGIVASLVALVSNGVETAVIVAIIVVAVNQIEGHVLAPLILGNALKISPLAILLALSIGAILGGIVGTLLAVPLVAVSWVVWNTWANPKSQKAEENQEPELDEQDNDPDNSATTETEKPS